MVDRSYAGQAIPEPDSALFDSCLPDLRSPCVQKRWQALVALMNLGTLVADFAASACSLSKMRERFGSPG